MRGGGGGRTSPISTHFKNSACLLERISSGLSHVSKVSLPHMFTRSVSYSHYDIVTNLIRPHESCVIKCCLITQIYTRADIK